MPPNSRIRAILRAGLTSTGDISAINLTKSGDDDHPSYTDSNLSEAMAARVINAIAGNPEIWAHSAIIITYDESDGFYDHVPPRILSYGPDGLPLARGVRVPLIVISPFARAGAVSHAEGDHNSVIETINAIFGRPALSTLPDEAQALAQREFGLTSTSSARPASSRTISGRVTPTRRSPTACCPPSIRRSCWVRRLPSPASFADDPEQCRRDVPALRRQRLPGDRGHAGRSSSGASSITSRRASIHCRRPCRPTAIFL